MLKIDDTIETVLKHLTNKEKYLRRVIDNMYICNEKYSNPTVTIGRQGKGKNPCYLIQYDSKGVRKNFGTFFYSKRFDNNFDHKLWCEASMTLKQVEDLLEAVEAGAA